jgi:hypothetical protein
MVIYVPVKNLKGIFDNGFADISTFSFFSLEKEVLINAFNVFKILSFTKASGLKIPICTKNIVIFYL